MEPIYPPIQRVPEVFPRPRHVVDHSPPSSTNVKNVWSNTSGPPVCLNGVDKDKFTFTLPMFKSRKRPAILHHGVFKFLRANAGTIP